MDKRITDDATKGDDMSPICQHCHRTRDYSVIGISSRVVIMGARAVFVHYTYCRDKESCREAAHNFRNTNQVTTPARREAI